MLQMRDKGGGGGNAGEEVTPVEGCLGSAGTRGPSRWVLHPPQAGDGSALWAFALSKSLGGFAFVKVLLVIGRKKWFWLVGAAFLALPPS